MQNILEIIPDVNTYSNIKQSKRKTRATDDAPDYCDDIPKTITEESYSDNFWNAFGLATTNQVKVLTQQMCQLSSVQELNKNEIIKTNERLTSLSDNTNARLDNL